MQDRLFVYGTLAPGQPNEHVLKPLNGTWEPAVVHGRLSNQGWGSPLGFPGIRLDESGNGVSGLIFTAPGLRDFWPQLDDFEGDGYVRTLTTATLANGQSLNCFVYQLRPVDELNSSN